MADEFDAEVMITVDATQLFQSSRLPVIYQSVVNAFQAGMKSSSGAGKWVWRITVPGPGSTAERYIEDGRSIVVTAVADFVLRQLELGRDYLGVVLASGGPEAARGLGIVLPPLTPRYLSEKADQYGSTQFFEKTGVTLPQLLAQRPKLVGVSGKVFTYSWAFNNEKWTLFNVGIEKPEQKSRPALNIFRKFVQGRVTRLLSGKNVLSGTTYQQIADSIRRLQ